MVKYNNLFEMFATNAQKFPRKELIFFEGKSYSYRQVEHIVSAIADVLLKQGVTKGTKVGLLLNNSPEFVFSVFAIWACGAIAIPINVFLKDREVSYIIDDSRMEFLMTSKDFTSVIQYVKRSCRYLIDVLSYDTDIDGTVPIGLNIDDCLKAGKRCSKAPVVVSDEAVYIYTSGTTGNPKGVILTHYNLLCNMYAIPDRLGLRSSDKFLVMLPMFHTYTFTTCVMMPIYLGGAMIILPSAMSIRKSSLRYILLFKRPTTLVGIPQVFLALTRAKIPSWFIKLFYSIRLHISGGTSLPQYIAEQFYKKFNKPLIEGYGLSEASPVVSFNPLAKQKAGSVGVALGNIRVKIVDNNGAELPVGEIGHLVIKSGSVMKGYWGMHQATVDTIRDGWLWTGDLAKIDSEGYITIVDRDKDVIIVKGINVYPREVEDLIYSFMDFEAVAVIGVTSLELGEIVCAYIQLKEGQVFDEKALRAYLKTKLANFKLPREIKVISNMPLTSTGKISKKDLRDMVARGEV